MGERTISTPRLIRFGVYEVDLQAGELRKQGVKIKLEGQPLGILALLLERPGQLVTREELKQKLWPADTFVDFEHSINAAVKRLRGALGDSADSPRFVETLPRHGYRFICPVEDGAAEVRRPAARWRRRWVASLLLFALPALLLGLLAGNVGGLRDWLLGTSAGAPITSLAVLPLDNLSGDPEQEYFVDGMTEALITELGKISALRVISRQSAMQFKGTDKSLPEIARKLNVDAIVEGAVVREGNRVRVTAQLVQASPERHLWSETYERDLHSILAVQSEVARKIAREIKIGVTPEEEARLAGARPVNPKAHEAYLRGRYYLSNKFDTREGRKKAADYFQQAIDTDPTYAPAYAGLAEAYIGFERLGNLVGKQVYPKARAAALKALELDKALAEAHTALAHVRLTYDWDWEDGEKEYKRAIELNASSEVAHSGYSFYLSIIGRNEEAIAEAKRALQLDPFSFVLRYRLGRALGWAGQYEQRLEHARKMVELEPDSYLTHHELATAYGQKGMYDEAIAEFKRVEALTGKKLELRAHLPLIYARMGKREEALKMLDEVKKEWAERAPSQIAGVYAALGEKDQAFAWLEKAYDARETYVIQLKMRLPIWDNLRSDPRFQELLRRMNFPD